MIDERVELAQDLAATLLEAATKAQTRSEKMREQELGRMMQDHRGKSFISLMLDSCFRTQDSKRLIDQMLYLLSHYGIPTFFTWWQRCAVGFLGYGGRLFPKTSAHFIQKFVQSQLSEVIAPAEKLDERLASLKPLKVNLNRLGEAILGEHEAEARLEQNIQDLANPYVDVISVKVSSIKSQLSLVAYDNTLRRLKSALRQLYRAAMKHGKQVTLDMEEYKDLRLTVQLFQEVLSEPEFLQCSAGIALQSYIPDSFELQKQLTEWAIERKGAPIKIRIVKGANLGMERVEASIREWPQATYKNKDSVDANFKKMIHYGMQHAKVVNLGIGSHNLFDIAYAMVLAKEHAVEAHVTIEMLAGMAPHLARVMPNFWNSVLLYVPCAEKDQFHNAIAYLMRRLDENTAPNNFLTHLFGLKTTSMAWREQQELFYASCMASDTVSTIPRRGHKTEKAPINVPDTDFSLPQNQQLAREIADHWKVQYNEVTLCIGGHTLVSSEHAQGFDPSRPECKIHTHFLAQEYQANVALEFAHKHAPLWAEVPLSERIEMLQRVATILSSNRKKFLGAMMQEVAKNIPEADAEFSEAIDFVHYYTKDATTHAHAKT
ncbi:MAG: bifunctional proline dehydrogenase/L-glutamate gamma-semialdehyde dehydrogenase, partial [Verrucomicrobia bacterium]|nr:bifunctional proline dehydrogenase/L-glutamate gamma-semialdehyde dehydrogenase [Verrucomicrobiota bacterium]